MEDNLKLRIEELAKKKKLEGALIRIELKSGVILYGRTRGEIDKECRLIFLEPTGPHTNEVEEMLRDIRSFEIADAQWAAYYLNALSAQIDSMNRMMRAHRR